MNSWSSQATTPTPLNQYVQPTGPGYTSSLGTANSNATVSLWAADGSYGLGSRKGEYFRAELPVNNSTGAVWLTLTNLAVLTNGSNPDIDTFAAFAQFEAAVARTCVCRREMLHVHW